MGILSILGKVLLLSFAFFIIWYLYQFIKNRKDLFTVEVLNKSFFTMGILAVLLIIVISLTVFMLNN